VPKRTVVADSPAPVRKLKTEVIAPRHRTAAPVRRVAGFGLQHRTHHFFHLRIGDRGGTPERGSSRKPSTRRTKNRVRHLPTVCFISRSSRATGVWASPTAQFRSTRERKAHGRLASHRSGPAVILLAIVAGGTQ